jgi:hypothetical protein
MDYAETRTERPMIAAFILLAALGMVGNIDYADALLIEAEAKASLPFRALQNDPIKPPRCPRFNAESTPIKYSYAAKADRLEWVHLCHYEPWTKGTTK